jgi:hypothetical protein
MLNTEKTPEFINNLEEKGSLKSYHILVMNKIIVSEYLDNKEKTLLIDEINELFYEKILPKLHEKIKE